MNCAGVLPFPHLNGLVNYVQNVEAAHFKAHASARPDVHLSPELVGMRNVPAIYRDWPAHPMASLALEACMTASAADKLMAAAESVRRTGEGRYMMRCLAHKDRSASLSMRVLDDGRVLLHCFAGCSVDEIVRATGLNLQDLFPPRLPDGEQRRHKTQKPFVARDAVRALRRELTVAWVILADVAAGRNISDLDRQRAGIARDRCVALISEIED